VWHGKGNHVLPGRGLGAQHGAGAVQKLQQNRSKAAFEKTKKRMMLAAKIQDAIKAKNISYSRGISRAITVLRP
jgi:hypothetical protein